MKKQPTASIRTVRLVGDDAARANAAAELLPMAITFSERVAATNTEALRYLSGNCGEAARSAETELTQLGENLLVPRTLLATMRWPSRWESAVLHSNIEVEMRRLHELAPEQLANLDVAEANLECALGLPGSGNLDIPAVLLTIDDWAGRVWDKTVAHWPRFLQAPEEYFHSEANGT